LGKILNTCRKKGAAAEGCSVKCKKGGVITKTGIRENTPPLSRRLLLNKEEKYLRKPPAREKCK